MKELYVNSSDKLTNFIDKYYTFLLIPIFCLVMFNIFYNLGAVPINSFDEARHGVNSYEMLKNNQFIVNTFGYQKDFYNLKPPLSYWMIMIGYKLFGFSALGLRFYSAIAGLVTIIIITLFVNYKHGKTASLISSLTLATTINFITSHSVRTGDADSLFVLFFTISMIAMLLIEKNTKWLYLAGFSFSLAFLCKSWHAGAILVVGAFYLLISGTLFKLNFKKWITLIVFSTFPILIWGFLRFRMDGLEFFKYMINYDLLARTSTPLEGHTGGYLLYFKVLAYNYLYWIVLIIPALVIYIKLYRGEALKFANKYYSYLLLWIVIPLLLFTAAKTKLIWYILAIYPAIAIVIGIFISELLKQSKKHLLVQILIAVTIFLCMFRNENIILKQIITPLPDKVQIILSEMQNKKEYTGYKIYTLCGTNQGKGDWDQNQFLSAELYDDLIPENGGFDAYINDKSTKTLMIAPMDIQTNEIIKNKSYKIVTTYENYYILTRK